MPHTNEKIIPVLIEEELKNSYIDYSMSVIVARALPDIRDGLKPVHRRVLYGMLDLGLRHTSAYKKSARIVGEVLGKYHPHGDKAVYDTMVRMAQDFSMRYVLVDGQGNFGSIDGDSPAAMRYTEARLEKLAEEVLRDIDKDTVDFVPNFDESLKEPSVLPSVLPTLLVNGASGIAVGMATNIPPHNLSEIIDALVALIARPNLKLETLRKYLHGPDFPTGAMIFGDEGISEYFETGRGKITVRARAHIEQVRGGRERIIITELPYQVNKASLQEKIAGLVRDKKIEGITEIRDESDREGMRVVFELRKEADSESILKKLYKFSQMQTTFGVILLSLVDGQPKTLGIRDMLIEFLKFRHDVVLRRTRFELEKAERRAHILEGYIIALDNIDEVIAIIKKSRSVDSARSNLMKRFKLSEIQAQAILDMRLQRLTGLERKKIEDEYKALVKLIQKLRAILDSKQLRMQVVKEELLELKETYGDPRRTQIVSSQAASSNNIKELLKEQEYIITLTHDGRIKRFTFEDYENEKSLIKFTGTKSFTEYIHVSANSKYLLFFTNVGNCYAVRTSFIPACVNGDADGTTIASLLKFAKNEKVVNCMPAPKSDKELYFMIATADGNVKRVALSTLNKTKSAQMSVIGLKDKDEVIHVELTTGEQDVILATKDGMAIRFNEQDVRDMGLSAGGVRGITLAPKDIVINMLALKKKKSALLTVTSLGFGKRSDLEEFSRIKRGGKGIIALKVSDKVGAMASILEVEEKETVMLITAKSKVKRLKAKDIKLMGRATHGAVVAAIPQKDEIAATRILPKLKKK